MDSQPQAAIFRQPTAPLQLVSVPRPQLSCGEILVRLDCCTLCASDLHTLSGKRDAPRPSVLGHEMVGRIEALGSPRTAIDGRPLNPGDRISWSIAASCGECSLCSAGVPQKCDTLFKYGHQQFPLGHAAPTASPDNTSVQESRSLLAGGLATHCHLVPETAVVHVPAELPDAVACPANCATATVTAARRIANGFDRKNVLVLGGGMLGLTAAAMARHDGAGQVIVADVDPQRLQLAERFGASQIVWLDPQQDPERHELAISGACDWIDLALEMSGALPAVELGLAALRTGGQLVLVGSVFPAGKWELDPERLVRRLIQINGLHNYAPQDLVAAMEFLADAHERFPFSELVGGEYSLEQVNEAVASAMSKSMLRVSVCPQKGLR